MNPKTDINQLSNAPRDAGFIMSLRPTTNTDGYRPSSMVRLYDLPTEQEKQAVEEVVRTQLSLLAANNVVFDGDYLLSLVEQPLEAFRNQYPSKTDDFVIDVRGNEEEVTILVHSHYGEVVRIISQVTAVSLDKTDAEVTEGYVPIVLEQNVEQKFGIISMATIGNVKGLMSVLSPDEQKLVLFLRNNPATVKKLEQLSSIFAPVFITPSDLKYDAKHQCLTICGHQGIKFVGQQAELLDAYFGHPGQNPASLTYETLYKRIKHKDWYAATEEERDDFITSLRRRARGINDRVRIAIRCQGNLFEIKKKSCSISPYL